MIPFIVGHVVDNLTDGLKRLAPDPACFASRACHTQVKKAGSKEFNWMWEEGTYLENRFRILPAGVVSKKDMGDLKIAVAMRSCSFREALPPQVSAGCFSERDEGGSGVTYLDRAEDPENQGLRDSQGRCPNAKGKVDTNVLSNLRVKAGLGVCLGPFLQPNTPAYVSRLGSNQSDAVDSDGYEVVALGVFHVHCRHLVNTVRCHEQFNNSTYLTT